MFYISYANRKKSGYKLTSIFRTKLVLSTVVFGLIAAISLFGVSVEAGSTFTVTNTNDSGAGSLRQAIISANKNGNGSDADTILFDIKPRGEVHTIRVNSDLPRITESLVINGFSQAGSRANNTPSPQPHNSEIKVEIAGADQARTTGLNIVAANTQIRGVSLYGFETGVFVNAPNVVLEGNYLNANFEGVSNPSELNFGATIETGDGCSGLRIGGTNSSSRNIILGPRGASNTAGISIDCPSSQVFGNFVGLGKDGVSAFMGQTGIEVGSDIVSASQINTNIQIGGSTSNQRNVISGADGAQIALFSQGNKVQGNYIGTDSAGDFNESVSNGAGVIVQSASRNNLIGGANSEQGNLIRGTRGGVVVIDFYNSSLDTSLTPQNVAILGNTIYDVQPSNFYGQESGGLGINILEITDTDNPADYLPESVTNIGPNKNDSGDGDGGANGKINYPEVISASQEGNKLRIKYNLDISDAPGNNYRVEFFINDNQPGYPYGAGQKLVGVQDSVKPGKNKNLVVDVDENNSYKLVSATATVKNPSLPSGYGATSEFSKNVIVTSKDDTDGDGIGNIIENQAPNSGDANADGIKDSQQTSVVSLPSSTGEYMTLVGNRCEGFAGVRATPQDDLNSVGYIFSQGIIEFRQYCSYKEESRNELFIHNSGASSDFQLVSYSDTRSIAVPDQKVEQVEIGGQDVVKLSFTISDGGDFDTGDSANGVVEARIGPGIEDDALSGVESDWIASATLLIIALSIVSLFYVFNKFFSYNDYLGHKGPLLAENPHLKYSYLHYVRVVSLPQFKYRFIASYRKILRKVLRK